MVRTTSSLHQQATDRKAKAVHERFRMAQSLREQGGLAPVQASIVRSAERAYNNHLNELEAELQDLGTQLEKATKRQDRELAEISKRQSLRGMAS